MSSEVSSGQEGITEGITSKLNEIDSKLDQIINILIELKNYIES